MSVLHALKGAESGTFSLFGHIVRGTCSMVAGLGNNTCETNWLFLQQRWNLWVRPRRNVKYGLRKATPRRHESHEAHSLVPDEPYLL